MKIDNETIKKARQTNLAKYLLSKGEELERVGNRHRHKKHDSLIFTENAYYWNSQGKHGNAVDFLMNFYNMDFKTAIAELTGFFTSEEKNNIKPIAVDFTFSDVKTTTNMDRTIAYLNKKRYIDYGTIQELIKNKLIFQEETTNNIIFPIYDEKGEIVGAETCGTLSDIRYKGIKSGSKYGYGYNIKCGTNFKYILFFESAVDLISFIEIQKIKKNPLDNCVFVSLAGLKENVFTNMLSVLQDQQQEKIKPVLCVDNDKAGRVFINKIKTIYQDVKIRQSEKFKDWNELLINLKNEVKKIENGLSNSERNRETSTNNISKNRKIEIEQ